MNLEHWQIRRLGRQFALYKDRKYHRCGGKKWIGFYVHREFGEKSMDWDLKTIEVMCDFIAYKIKGKVLKSDIYG